MSDPEREYLVGVCDDADRERVKEELDAQNVRVKECIGWQTLLIGATPNQLVSIRSHPGVKGVERNAADVEECTQTEATGSDTQSPPPATRELDQCDGCGDQFSIYDRKDADHVVRFPNGLNTAREDRLRYCSPLCFVTQYDTNGDHDDASADER